jgi:cell division protein FtsW
MSGPIPQELPPQAQRYDTIERAPVTLDWVLLSVSGALALLGVLMVASSSVAIAEGFGQPRFYYLYRHLVFLALGLALGFALLKLDLKRLERYSQPLLLLAIGLLLLVFVPGIGQKINGARRWITLGISNFQVVEVAKLLVIVYLAGFMVRRREEIARSLIGALKPICVAGVAIVLLLAQPDYGGAMLLLGITGGMVWLAGVRVRHLIVMGALVIPPVVWLAVSESYRVKRINSFLDPWADPFGDSFQLTQALIAIGRGEWFGVGLGASVQKLFYLPEAHTDFVLAVLAEELGLLGVIGVVVLFALLVGRAFQIGLKAVETGLPFHGFVAFGIGLSVGLQSIISIGVNLGMLPTKGLTLPLISSGGSSVMMTVVTLALLLRVAHEVHAPRPKAGALHAPMVLKLKEVAAQAPLPSMSVRREEALYRG